MLYLPKIRLFMIHHDTPSHRFDRLFDAKFLHAPKTVQDQDRQNIFQSLTANTPLFLEIGAGKGKHAIQFASSNTDKHLIAIERTREKFNAFQKQAALGELNNLTFVHADAIAFCAHFIAPNSLDGVFILYPNPEPHNKNQRWLNMPFFEFLLSRLKAGGFVIIASNIESYMDEACQLLDEVWQLPYTKRAIDSTSARTHFEIKYLARGELCQEIILTKPACYQTRFDDTPAKEQAI